jgi:peptidyl-prolyl cis-trans isomerase D
MISAFRVFAQSWVAKALIGLLIVAFLFFGIRDVFHGRITDAVVTAGSRQISSADFKRMFDNYKAQAEQQAGQQVTVQEAVAQGLDLHVLQEVATNEAFAEFLRRIGLRPSETLVADALRKQPSFFDPVSGKFDKTAYEQKLAENHLTPTTFEGLLRDDIAQSHLAAGVAAGLKAPRIYGALIAGYEMEGRGLTYFVVDPSKVPPPTPPTDAQLQAFMTQNADKLKRPEFRTLTVLRFSAKDLAATLQPDPAAVQKLYDFRKDTLSTPENRSLVQVPVKDAATAQAIAAKINGGMAPEAAARSIGVQPVIYADTPKSAIADSKVADTAFTMTVGQVSGPIQGALGYAVVKLNAITPAKVATLDSVRADLETQVRIDAATQKVYDEVQKYDDAHSGGASLAEAAKTAGATPISIGPISAQGADLTGKPAAGLSPKMLKEAFGLPQGGETDMEDDGKGEYFAIRVDKVAPPALPTLAEIKEPLSRYFMTQAMGKALQAKAEELAQAIRKGETVEAAAASIHAQVGHAPTVSRQAVAQNRSLSGELKEKIFSVKQGEVVTGPTAQLAVMVARVDTVQPPPAAQAAQMVVAQQNRLSLQVFQDVGELARAAARDSVKPTMDLARARLALGLSPDDLPKGAVPTAGSNPSGPNPAGKAQ